MGRWTTVVGVIISIGAAYIALGFKNIMDYLQLLFSFFNAPLFAAFLLGMFWKRTTGHGAFWGLVSGTSAAGVVFDLDAPRNYLPNVAGSLKECAWNGTGTTAGTYPRPRTFLSSGGLGTMGYGFPAAIGAQIGRPSSVVWDIAGDGSIQMNIQEMATAVANRLPVKIAVLNNGFLGMVRQWQQLFYRRRYSHTDIDVGTPDFVKLAEAYGAVGLRVTEPAEVRPAVQQAMKIKDRPCLIDFHVCREENVMPMVPAGGSIDEMMID
jgi:hypothetical protein